MKMVFVPYRKHKYGPPPSVKGTALLLYEGGVCTSQETHLLRGQLYHYMKVVFVPHRKHTSVKGTVLPLYEEGVCTSQETHLLRGQLYYSTSLYSSLFDDGGRAGPG
jgi:transposase-like protein